MKKPLLFITMAAALFSCSNKQDYGYNEKITSLFYECKEKLDERHQKLLEGDFKADSSNEVSYPLQLRDAKALGENASENKAESNELKHSETANAFHANILSYMSKIADDYTPLLVQYVEQQDSIARQNTLTKLVAKRIELTALENKCLESQIAFLNEAGIKINTESGPQ